MRRAFGGLAQRIDIRRLDANGSGRTFYALLASYAGHLQHGAALKAWEAVWTKHIYRKFEPPFFCRIHIAGPVSVSILGAVSEIYAFAGVGSGAAAVGVARNVPFRATCSYSE